MAAFMLAVGAVSVVGVGTVLWRNSRAEAQQRADTVAQALGPAVGAALASGTVEGVRDALIKAAQHAGVRMARLTMPDGSVVAESDPTAPAMKALPPTGSPAWLGSGVAAQPMSHEAASVVDVDGPGRSRLRLEVRTELASAMALNWQVQAVGLGIVGVTLSGAMLAWRGMSRRLRGPGAIREALRAMSSGETQTSVLTIGSALGPEAAVWNGLLEERDRLKQHATAEGLRETLSRRGGGAGQLAQACDALWHGVIVIDDKKRISYANGAAAVLLGARRERLGEGTYDQHVTDAAVRGMLAELFSGKVKRRMAVEVKRGEGPQAGVLRFSGRPIGRDDSGGVVIYVEDVTQQRIADASRNSFVAQATHELRTPLTNIRLYVEQAIEAEHDVAARSQALNVIGQESLRLERIVADMLSVSEIEAGSMKLRQDDVRLDELFNELRAEFMPQAIDKAIELGFELPPKLPVAHGDRDKIGQALHNLIGNALKYTKGGGKVSVRVECTPDRLSVDVTDSGIGISPGELDLVFEKFYRAKDKRIEGVTGTGLGLPLAREVARLHGGDVTVRSELNKGSTFTFVIPLNALGPMSQAA